MAAMITAGLAPACPAAAHQLLAAAMARRAMEPLWGSPLAVTLALALPLALLTLAAIWCWRNQRRFLRAVVLLAVYALQPPAVLPLAASYPLHASGRPRPMAPALGALLLAAAAIVLFVLTPDCAGAERPRIESIAGDVLLVTGKAVGVI